MINYNPKGAIVLKRRLIQTDQQLSYSTQTTSAERDVFYGREAMQQAPVVDLAEAIAEHAA